MSLSWDVAAGSGRDAPCSVPGVLCEDGTVGVGPRPVWSLL